MNLTEYQQEALKTQGDFWNSHKYRGKERFEYVAALAAAAISGEAGELLNKIKKRLERGNPFPIEESIDELGDILWYVTNLAQILLGNPYALDTVANSNILKLRHRHGEKFDPTELASRGLHTGGLAGDNELNSTFTGPNNNPQVNSNMDGK